MTTALAAPPLLLDPPGNLGRADASQRRPDSSGGRKLTLQQKLDSVWEGLRADGAAECPACGGTLGLTGHRTARCGGCGSQLS